MTKVSEWCNDEISLLAVAIALLAALKAFEII